MNALLRSAALVLGALALPIAAQAAEKPPPSFPYPLKVDRLPNGLIVTRVQYPSPGLIAYYTAVRVGSRNELEPGHTGFAHFFEHMMFKGTARFPEGERDRLLTRLGFNDNAFTTDDLTVYHSYGPSSALEKLVEVEADRFQNLDYSEASFQTEAKAVLGEYHKSAASPELRLEEVIAATAFTRHPYRHTTLGDYEDIKRMPQRYEYSRQFFKRWYTPDNCLLFVVGDFDDEQLMNWVRQRYGGWQGKAASIRIPVEPLQTRERTNHIDWPQATLTRLVYAWHSTAIDLDRPESLVQNVVGPYLVGAISPVYQELVLKEQRAEYLDALSPDHRDPNLLLLIALLKDPKHLPAARKALDRAVAELVAGKVDPSRLEAVKSSLRYGLQMHLETADQVGAQLAQLAGLTGDPHALERYHRTLGKIEARHLVQYAQKYLRRGNRTVVTLTSQVAPAVDPASVRAEGQR